MSKTQNYTEEETQLAIGMYEKGGNESITNIAEKLNKSINSVRAKLVREKVYVAPDKPLKMRKNGPSKKEIIRELETLGLSPDGLDGATKIALNNIRTLIEELKEDAN